VYYTVLEIMEEERTLVTTIVNDKKKRKNGHVMRTEGRMEEVREIIGWKRQDKDEGMLDEM